MPFSYGRASGGPGRQARGAVGCFGGSAGKKEEKKQRRVVDSDFANFFANFAVEPEPFLGHVPRVPVPPDQYAGVPAGPARRRSIGRKLANRYGWKIGDTFFLESFIPPYRKATGRSSSWCEGIFDADRVKYPATDTN